MERRVRVVLLTVATIQAVVAGLFVFQVPLPAAVWPFPGTSPLSTIFIGSIYAAAAASTAWCAVTGANRALVGIALDYIAILVPFAVISLAKAAGGAGTEVAVFGGAALAGLVVGVVLLRWALAREWHDPLPVPRPVRAAFAIFVAALLVVGGLLVVQVPDILPWNVTPELSTLFGFMFLGAAAYFAFGILQPRWENAGGQLAGFLAYDLVLIVPFLARLPTVDDHLRPNLLVYTAVLVASGVVATYYLVIDGSTRIGSTRRPAPEIQAEPATTA